MTREEIEKEVSRFVDRMGEHCDSVRCFVTHPTLDGNANTVGFTSGIGNIYAQLGQVDDWLETQRENVRIEARRIAEDEDGGGLTSA